METVALGVNSNLDGSTVRGRGLEGILSGIVTARRELLAAGVRELEWLAISANEGVSERVEGKVASESHSSDNIGRCDKCVGSRVGIVTSGEVTVIGGDDCEKGRGK